MTDHFSIELRHPATWTWLRLLLLSPLLEEWVLRAGLQHWLYTCRPRPVWLAGVIPAVIFALLHARYGLPFVLMTLIPGCAMSAMFHRWRDWRLCALAHAAMNGALLLFLK